jgi:hypothetical protein
MIEYDLIPRLLPLVEERPPGKSWSRDLLKPSRILIDDDDFDKYLIFILYFITCVLFCKFDFI